MPTSRKPAAADDRRIVPLTFEPSGPDAAGALAPHADDVNIVVNNARIITFTPLLADRQEEAERVFNAVTFGSLRAANAFVPILAANTRDTLVNPNSLTAWNAGFPSYGESKSWSRTSAATSSPRSLVPLKNSLPADTGPAHGNGRLACAASGRITSRS